MGDLFCRHGDFRGARAAPVLGICFRGLLDCWQNSVDLVMALWEQILLGVLALIVLFWMGPGVKSAMERSRSAPRDWPGVLIPVGLVLLFVVFLIAMVR
jgi:hypothetical protein